MRRHISAATAVFALLAGGGSLPLPDLAAETAAKRTLQGADWELQMLGVTDDQMLQGLRALSRRRAVTIAVVGEGGVSRSELAPVLAQGNTVEYRDGATDPQSGTHDTGQVRVVLELTLKLGLQVRLLVYQPPDDYGVVGEAFARAGREADVVLCFHSFWGQEVTQMAEKVRQTPTALFIAPYGEFEGRPTGTSWQAHAAKPGGGGIPHFVTCIPLARRSPGELLRPSSRDAYDTETINFIAPSFHANGPGGTCPAAATTAAVAAFVVAASVQKPTPAEVARLLRETAAVDRAVLGSVAEMDEETVKRLEAEVARLAGPVEGTGQRKLDAAGTLSLRNVYFKLVKAALPPATRPPRRVVQHAAPRVCVLGDKAQLENSHVVCEFSTRAGLSLVRLFSKPAAVECLAAGCTSSPFALLVGDGLVSSEEFHVANIQQKAGERTQRLVIRLTCAEPQLAAEFSIELDESAEMVWRLNIRNRGHRSHRLRVFFPLLKHVLLGKEPKTNYWFFPCMGGWCSNLPCDLGVAYGTGPGSLQVISVFDPSLGGGVYTYVKDSSGKMKVLFLRKVDDLDEPLVSYVPLWEPSTGREPSRPRTPFPKEKGAFIGVCTMARELQPGQSLALPPTVVAAHTGDWHRALRSYSDWAHRTWWHTPEAPKWLKRCFNFCYSHDEDSVRAGRYVARPEIPPSYHVMQWAYWWKHSNLDRLGQPRKPDPWYREVPGDYEYEERWGGKDALRQEVKRYQDAGSRMILYLQSYLVWKHSTIGKEHSRDWGALWPDGSINEDYTDEQLNMNCWGLCSRFEPWQDYLTKTCARLVRETGVDGVYLDSMNITPSCCNPNHRHDNEWRPNQAARLLRNVRAAILKENRQAILWVEHPCSDYLMQFIDCTWLETFAANCPIYPVFNDPYRLHFLRYYFPEIKYAEWNPDCWKPDLQRQNLFNGIGTGAAGDYLARTGRMMRENAEAFATLKPEPLVPTEKEGVFANCFPIESKTVYTVWNRNPEPVSGVLLKVPHGRVRPSATQSGSLHYVELLSGRTVACKREGNQAALSFEIPAGEVVAIAQLPKLFTAARSGMRLTVRLIGKVRQPRLVLFSTSDPDAAGRPLPLKKGTAEADLTQLGPAPRYVIVKLFSGEELADQAMLAAQGVQPEGKVIAE